MTTLRYVGEMELLPSAARTNATAANGADVDVSQFSEGEILLDVTAVSGTSPTLTLTLEVKSRLAAGYFTHTALESALAIAGAVKKRYAVTNFGGIIRVVHNVGGTTPSITYSLTFVGKT